MTENIFSIFNKHVGVLLLFIRTMQNVVVVCFWVIWNDEDKYGKFPVELFYFLFFFRANVMAIKATH